MKGFPERIRNPQRDYNIIGQCNVKKPHDFHLWLYVLMHPSARLGPAIGTDRRPRNIELTLPTSVAGRATRALRDVTPLGQISQRQCTELDYLGACVGPSSTEQRVPGMVGICLRRETLFLALRRISSRIWCLNIRDCSDT